MAPDKTQNEVAKNSRKKWVELSDVFDKYWTALFPDAPHMHKAITIWVREGMSGCGSLHPELDRQIRKIDSRRLKKIGIKIEKGMIALRLDGRAICSQSLFGAPFLRAAYYPIWAQENPIECCLDADGHDAWDEQIRALFSYNMQGYRDEMFSILRSKILDGTFVIKGVPQNDFFGGDRIIPNDRFGNAEFHIDQNRITWPSSGNSGIAYVKISLSSKGKTTSTFQHSFKDDDYPLYVEMENLLNSQPSSSVAHAAKTVAPKAKRRGRLSSAEERLRRGYPRYLKEKENQRSW